MKKMKKSCPAVILALLLLAGCAQSDAGPLSVCEVEFGNGASVSLLLPRGASVSSELSSYEENIPIAEPHETFRITLDGKTIGNISLTDFSDHQWVEIDGFLATKDPATLYQGIITGMNYGWGNDYSVVTEDDEAGTGSAVSLVSYSAKNPASVEHLDLDECGQPFLEDGDSPDNYYNRAVLGYDLTAEYWVAVELNYACITDEEQTEIARSLRIEAG